MLDLESHACARTTMAPCSPSQQSGWHRRTITVHHRGSKYTSNAARDAELRLAAKLGDDIVQRLHQKYGTGKYVSNVANIRGDDYDRRQMIADLLFNDASPFGPDDEDSLRMLPDKTLRALRDQFLATNRHAPVSNRQTFVANADELHAMAQDHGTSDVARAIANSRAENERIRQRADEYCRRNPIARNAPALHANSSDEEVAAMSQNIGAVAFIQNKGR
jgi:hypothetical protein